MKKLFAGALILTLVTLKTQAQVKSDTVIVSLAKTSKVIFTIEDKADLEILKHYNFQELFEDILKRLEPVDTIKTDSARDVAASEEEDWSTQSDEKDRDSDDDDAWEEEVKEHKGRVGRTWQSTNLEIGTNNFISDGKVPSGNEYYTVRPWGSWYVGITSLQRTRIQKKFFLEWGLGVTWYNFKFQEDNTLLRETDAGVEFVPDERDLDYIKSKLTVSYVNLSIVPVLDLGDHNRRPRVWDGYSSEFRTGIGPYIGYRIGSRYKMVYEDDDGNKEKEKDNDNFYLNNVRYGVRFQLGFRSADFFFNYDLNELFAEGKGPQLNAISFGVVF